MALWGGRFAGGSSDMFKQVNDSLPFDYVMAEQDIFGSIIWSRALCKAGVLSEQEQKDLESALSALKDKVSAGEIDFAASLEEDIHSFVEAALTETLGDTARKLHTGRSRNDQVATDFRLWCREHLESLKLDCLNVIKALLSTASRHENAIIPGYTHLQRAQPVYFAHWCLAYVEMLKRDVSRIDDMLVRLNKCPLGCGALAGTTFPVDRDEIAQSLGFDEPCLNSLDAVSDRDFVLELLFVASTSMMHISRMAEDLIFYNSGEAGFLQLGDSVTSGSSLMPQKKNPDALELMRGKCGRVFGNLQGLLVTMKGLPLAYNKDMQEDKEGAIDTVNQWHICLCITVEVLDSLALNEERTRTAAQQGYANATELADYLVDKGIPFRTAHDISGQAVVKAISKSCALEELSLEELQAIHSDIEDDVYPTLTLEAVLNKRNILGGTSKETVTKALYLEHERLDTLMASFAGVSDVMPLSDKDSIKLFRSSAPYINAHRGKTFVIMFGGEAVADEHFPKIIQDIALLNSLGIRLVLVHGARPQIAERIAIRNKKPVFVNDIRVTDKETLECVKDAAGSLRSQIEALLTMGLPNSPMHGARIRVCSGNLVVAKPLGVQDGLDFENTGLVRRIDTQGINENLDDGSIVLLSPMGYSTTGEVFNLSHEDVATQAAIALNADKIITLSEHHGIYDTQGTLLRTSELNSIKALISSGQIKAEASCLHAMIKSVEAGIDRAHCVSYKVDGSMLKELFTRDGAGSLVMQNHYEKIRTACIDDVGGILKLIKPLEENGTLVKRSRERLESEISQFTVIERDGMIIGCAALYAFDDEACAEIACVATHPDYRGQNRGERLLEALKRVAMELNLERLFVLTTITSHWFLEQGFEQQSIEHLPESRQEMYNYTRNSKVFVLDLYPS